MKTIFTFGSIGIKKRYPIDAFYKSNRKTSVSSVGPAIVSSQHEYDFVPTTQRQIII